MFSFWIVPALTSLALAQAQPAPEQPTTSEHGAPRLLLDQTSTSQALRGKAETYAQFHLDVGQAGARELRSGADLDATMDSLAQYYTGDRLVNAQIAYASLVAAQHPDFIDSVRALADYYGPEVARSALLNDPTYVASFMGAERASRAVVGAISDDVASIEAVGERYKSEAYALQNETWARRRANDRQERISALESASSRLNIQFSTPSSTPASPLTGQRLGAASNLTASGIRASSTNPNLSLRAGQVQLTPDERRVGRMLAVAALQSIEAGDMTAFNMLLADPGVERCITWARLTLGQCIAAGHFKYEDSFCIAEHALNDVAQCLSATRPVSN